MKLLEFTRYSEWWEYKMVPLLAITYAFIHVAQLQFAAIYYDLIFSLSAIVVGAVYVSVINDMTDINEDLIAGKRNRMASVPVFYRKVIVSCCLIAGAIFGFMIYPNMLSLFFYLMAWIAFSLYSISPFRLKKRGVWGVVCDAMGAHLFPTLFVVTYLSGLHNSTLSSWWYFEVGVWSFAYGLRGILWHQFFDRNNDLKSGTTTFATKRNPEHFYKQELIIFTIEVAAFAAIFIKTINIWTASALGTYIILVFIRTFAFKYQNTLIITPIGCPHQILLNDFYLVFFPLSLLLTSTTSDPKGWIFLCCHLVLFPSKTILVFNDFTFFLRTLSRK